MPNAAEIQRYLESKGHKKIGPFAISFIHAAKGPKNQNKQALMFQIQLHLTLDKYREYIQF